MNSIEPDFAPASAEQLRRSLRATREAIYDSGHATAEDGQVLPVWPAGVTRNRGQALCDLAVAEQARRCLETGFAFAMSASFLLEAALSEPTVELSPGLCLLVSIDPFQTKQWHGSGRRHLQQAGARHLHQLFEEPSEAVLPRLLAERRRFDLAFIDGDHRFEHVFMDVFFARRLVGHGKLIVLDDDWLPSVQKAAAFFLSAGLCSRVPTQKDSPLSAFDILRVEAAGDDRDWTHFANF